MNILTAYKNLKDPSFWEEVEFNRFGISAMLITVQSCVGGAAIGFMFKYGFGGNLLMLWIISATTMAANAAVIAQPPMKWVVGFSIIAMLMATLISIYVVLAGTAGI